MTKLQLIGAVALLSVFAASPAFAHDGVVHAGCAAGQVFTAGDITVTGAFTRATLPGAKAAGGYFEIANAGAAPDRLVGATSEAGSVELHQMTMEGDVMKMSEIEGGIEVPAGGSVALAPGGLHLMFMGMTQPFNEGECVEATLAFERAGDLPIVLNVGPTGAQSAPEDHAGH